ncbi:MAG: hypothetical protein Sw2PiBPW_02140 [Shewanella algae]
MAEILPAGLALRGDWFMELPLLKLAIDELGRRDTAVAVSPAPASAPTIYYTSISMILPKVSDARSITSTEA